MTLDLIIAGCLKDQREAQKALYDRYAPVLLGVVRRYISDTYQAEDILMEAFYKILTHLESYQGAGSFDGWMKRIVINETLMHLRKRNNFQYSAEVDPNLIHDEPTIVDHLEGQAILGLLDELPVGYRTVFNLFVIEGYKHREIADLLGISINTSKSQLIQAKEKLKILIKQKLYPQTKA